MSYARFLPSEYQHRPVDQPDEPPDFEAYTRTAPDTVACLGDAIDSWATALKINGYPSPLLVGRQHDDHDRTVFDLYHHPLAEAETGLAATLYIRDRYGQPTSVAVEPAGTAPDDDTADKKPLIPVLDVEPLEHPFTPLFSELLPEIRTALTDSDWTNGRADTTYPEWMDAANTLADLVYDDVFDTDLVLPPKVFTTPEVTHAVARYPLNGRDFMSHVGSAIERHIDAGFYAVNPEAVRYLLLRYAKAELSVNDERTARLDTALSEPASFGDPATTQVTLSANE